MFTDDSKKNYYNILANREEVLLVDVMNHLHRFLWVNKDLSVIIDDKEVLTGHIYGFLRYITFFRSCQALWKSIIIYCILTQKLRFS